MWDYRAANLAPSDRALCDYAVKLTLMPGDMNNVDVDILRGHGFNDDAVHIAAQVIGYFNYINRIADGLGVEPDPWMTSPTLEDWLARKGRDYGEG